MISKYKIYSYTIPLLLGLCSGACSNILQNSGTLVLSDGSLYVAMAAYCALYCGAFWATEGIVGRSASRRDPIEGEREGGPSRGAIGRVVSCFGGVELTLRSVLSVGAAIFLLWLPYIVHLYPGVYWMDTSYQISEYVNLSDGAIGDQYPFLTTVIVGAFAKAGFALTGDYFLGTYLLILIQSALTAVALAALCCYLGRWGVSTGLRTLMAAFFALFPFFPCMMGTLCKDTLHLPFEIAFALLYAEAWRARGEDNGRILAPLVLAAAMASLTKKTGLIVCSGSLFALLLAVKAMHRKAQVAGALAVTLLLVSVVAPAVAGVAVSIVPGGRQEIYSVPLQIVANVARIEPAALSEDDLDLVRGTYPIRPDEIPESYQWQAADGVKRYSEGSDPDYLGLCLLAARLGIQYPRLALEAWGGLVADWFSWDTGASLTPIFESRTDNEATNSLAGWDPRPDASGSLSHWYDVVSSMPLVNLLFSKTVWVTTLPALCAFTCLRLPRGRRASTLALLAPLLLNVAAVMVGPTSIWNEAVRYALPFVALSPLFLSLVISEVMSAAGNRTASSEAVLERGVLNG